MIPELGHFALIIALLLALIQGLAPIAGAQLNIPRWMSVAFPAALGQLLFVAGAFGCLAYAFMVNDFSVKNVAHHSFSQLPAIYRFTATWGSHEGSLLLWVLILNLWTLAVSFHSRSLPATLRARVLGVMGLIGAGFQGFLLITSNPFERLIPVPPDGADLNPLLQDLGMVMHPPMLYMGYVGFSVSFAFAIAALLSGRLDAAWARWARPWATLAWMFLTLGIALGSFWAYYELGWGGWWFWDPTENASLMPWLAGTALIHALAVTDQRAGFKNWTLLLSIITFSLSLLGTFLVRSGILSSVHAFATDPGRGLYILGFLGTVIGGSLTLFAWRSPRMVISGAFAALSRESLLLGNQILLMAALASVMLGTLYPLFLDVLGFGKVSVGPPYFNSVFIPLMAPLLFLAAIGPRARWKKAKFSELFASLRMSALLSILGTLCLSLYLDRFAPTLLLGLFLALWIPCSIITGLGHRLRLQTQGLGTALRSLPRAYLGMQSAHFGLAVLIAGITLVSHFATDQLVRMDLNDHVELAGYRFVFKGTSAQAGPNYVADRATLEVTGPRGETILLEPEKRMYQASRIGMTEAAIDYGVFRDLYASLGEHLGGTAWSVRVYHKPCVAWLWAGALLMAIGAGLAATDPRYRLRITAPTRPAPLIEANI